MAVIRLKSPQLEHNYDPSSGPSRMCPVKKLNDINAVHTVHSFYNSLVIKKESSIIIMCSVSPLKNVDGWTDFKFTPN